MYQTHCKEHGLKLERMTLEAAKKRSFFFRFMCFFSSKATKFDRYGQERMVLVCPKNDYLISE